MANDETILSYCRKEGLIKVIDWCDDIDDKSSVYYNPDKLYPIPDRLEEDNIWYTSDELEESNDKESGIREYKYVKNPEETAMCGKKKKSNISR